MDVGACGAPPPPGSGAIGGDVSSYAGSGAWACAAQAEWSFMIVRSYCETGNPDSNALPTIQAAAAGGIETRDVYHFSSCGGRCSPAAEQRR